jgi:hypothetical protein
MSSGAWRSFLDLQVGEGNARPVHPSLWNRLLARLEQGRLVAGPGIKVEPGPTHTMVSAKTEPGRFVPSVVLPFTIYQCDPYYTGSRPSSAWRTVRVAAGTVNGENPRKDGNNTFSDDGDSSDNSSKASIVLPASATVALWVRQTFNLVGDSWEIDKTYIEFGEVDENGKTSGWPGYEVAGDGIEQPCRNVLFKWIGNVTTGPDEGEGEDVQSLEITQHLDRNVEQPNADLSSFEVYAVAQNPKSVGAQDWRRIVVHTGTFNEETAVSNGADTYSDDLGADKVIPTTASTVSRVYIVQTRDTDEAIDKTYFKVKTPGTSDGWFGFPHQDHCRNASFRSIAVVTVGSESDPLEPDYMRLSVSQLVSSALTYELPSLVSFEPYRVWNDPHNPDAQQKVGVQGGRLKCVSRSSDFVVADKTPVAITTGHKIWLRYSIANKSWTIQFGADYDDDSIIIKILNAMTVVDSLVWFYTADFEWFGGDYPLAESLPVTVSEYSGDAGDWDTDCSFKYNVFTLGNIEILQDTAPVNKRTPKMPYVSGVKGLAWFKNDGGFEFCVLDEKMTPQVETLSLLEWVSTETVNGKTCYTATKVTRKFICSDAIV